MGMLETALQIAARAHDGQTDQQGEPYILHPLRVMAMVGGLEAKTVAVLHAVLEDTPVTTSDLVAAELPRTVVTSVVLLTRNQAMSYADYVVRAAGDPIAKQVKVADLTDNSSIERALMRPGTMRQDRKRLAKYAISYRFLTGEVSEAEYLAAMGEI